MPPLQEAAKSAAESPAAIIARADLLAREWDDFGAKKVSLPPTEARTTMAIESLSRISDTEPEYQAAQQTIEKIRAKARQHTKGAQAAEAAELGRQIAVRAREAIEERKNYASNLEHKYLKEGRDFTIRTEGRDASTLRIQWVLIGRPFVYNAINDEGVMATWRRLGFKTVVFTDGYNNTWRQQVRQ